MTRTDAWQPIEDEVLREGAGLPLGDICDAVNQLRRRLGMGNKYRTKAAVGMRCRKLGVKYKKG